MNAILDSVSRSVISISIWSYFLCSFEEGNFSNTIEKSKKQITASPNTICAILSLVPRSISVMVMNIS